MTARTMLLAIACAATLALAACASAESAQPQELEATSMPDLIMAVESAGVDCGDFEDRDQVISIPNSALGACESGNVVLAVFDSRSSNEVWSYTVKDLGREVLIGERWAVSADLEALQDLRTKIGGALVTDEMVEQAS